jgi:hypothetical protein
MRATRLIIIVAVLSGTLLACSHAQPEAEAKPAEAPPPPPEPPPPPPPEPPKPVVVEDLPPLRVVNGDGITLTETAGHRIRLQTTALWNEPIDTTYDDCEYFRKAIPVLSRQMTKERAKLLPDMCPAPEKKPAGKSASQGAKNAAAKAKPVQ